MWRAALLDDSASAFAAKPDLPKLLLDKVLREPILQSLSAWRETVKIAMDLGILMMATTASLAHLDAYRSERLPTNLIQAQRDFFGAHTYRRVDKEETLHTNWKS